MSRRLVDGTRVSANEPAQGWAGQSANISLTNGARSIHPKPPVDTRRVEPVQAGEGAQGLSRLVVLQAHCTVPQGRGAVRAVSGRHENVCEIVIAPSVPAGGQKLFSGTQD